MVWLRLKAVRKTETCSEALGREWSGIGKKFKTFCRKASLAKHHDQVLEVDLDMTLHRVRL